MRDAHCKLNRGSYRTYSRLLLLSRQGQPIIAHRFSGGTQRSRTPQSRQGRQTLRGRASWREALSSLPGLGCMVDGDAPPLKRWAIFNRPCRDAERTGHEHQRGITKCVWHS